jgi:hypothetical protein
MILAMCVAGESAAESMLFGVAKQLGQPNTTNDQVAMASAAATTRRLFVIGQFEGTVDFGVQDFLQSAGKNDIFLAWYDEAIGPVGSKRFGDGGDQYGLSVTTDKDDNVYITGKFEGTINFGGNNLTSSNAGLGVSMYLAKFEDDGDHLWSKRFGTSGTTVGNSVVTDADGNVYVTGAFDGSVDFGGGELMANGMDDLFLAKLNSAGDHQWSKRFGNTEQQIGRQIVVDANGNVVLTGYFSGGIDFGGGNLASSGTEDILLAKFNSAGTHQWSKRFGDADRQYGWSVAVDQASNVYLTGEFKGTVNFGGIDKTSSGREDVFIAKFDGNGTHQWDRRYGDDDAQHATGIRVTRELDPPHREFVHVTGYFFGTMFWGGLETTSQGSSDMFLTMLDTSGNVHWARAFGNSSTQYAHGLSSRDGISVYVTGSFYGDLAFGASIWDLGNFWYTSHGGADAYYAYFIVGNDLDGPAIIVVRDVPNDQGGMVEIEFTRSSADDIGAVDRVTHYEIFRRNEASFAQFASSNPALLPVWTNVGTVPADTALSYSISVPTERDSTLWAGIQNSVYYVRAVVSDSLAYDSPPDSGYSVDNLAPPAPTNLTFAGGVLSWDPSPDSDLYVYGVYGSTSNSFGSATPIDYPTSPSLVVGHDLYPYYFVTGWDIHGNEGDAASLGTLVGVVDGPRHVLSLSSHPNPFNPSTTIRYSVPSKGRVQIAVFNAQGSRVASLLEHTLEAGTYSLSWNGRDQAGVAVGSGVYFARLTHPTGVRSYKMVLLK